MTRTLSWRATVARLGGYKDTSARESSLAYTLCQRTLHALENPTLSLMFIHDAINISGHHATAAIAAVLTLPDLSHAQVANQCSPFTLVELYFTAGEMSEEVGRGSLSHDFVQDCYAVADQCFSQALNFDVKRSHMFAIEYDPSYLVRLYQRYISILERRLSASIDTEAIARKTLALLNSVLLKLPNATLTLMTKQ
jgi:hypothetical protein